MERRTFIKSLAAGAYALGHSGAARANAAPSRRNVLLYVTDDWGMNDAGCYGNPIVKTPGVDALAREGVRFTNAFCTAPSCSASRSVILSGQYNHANGMYGLAHDYHHFQSFDTIVGLPVRMANAGYRTLCAGKYHVAPEANYHFDEYLPVKSPIDMADACAPLLESRDERPFFLYFCTTEPHRTFNGDGFDPIKPEDVPVPPWLPDTPACRAELARYYRSIQRADSGLVRLMELLRQSGHWEDTLVIFISDNGMPWPGAKTTLYDPGVHLPCVVRNPFQGRQGLVNNALVSWVDLAPTILDFAGALGDAKGLQGRSFLPVLADPDPAGWDEVFLSQTFHEVTMYYPMRAIRTLQHKFIHNIAHGLEFPFASDIWRSDTWQEILKTQATVYGNRTVDAYLHRPRFELYDLATDPGEIQNLAADPAHAGLLEKFVARLKELQKTTRDPWRLKWEHE